MTTAHQVAGLTLDEWQRHSTDIRIRLAAAPYLVGWSYSRNASVIYALPTQMGAGRIEGLSYRTACTHLTISILTAVWPGAPWTAREYGDLQVYADRLPFSPDAPVKAIVRMGIGEAVGEAVIGHWHLVQGWRRLGDAPAGHAFLVLDLGRNGVQVLEASSRGNVGPRYRYTSWADLRAQYPAGLHIGVLPAV
jgi:hypothetical protein